MKKKKFRIGDIFMISKAKFAIAANVMIIAILAHNFMYGILGRKEAFFFILSMLAFAYFIIMSVYSVYVDVFKK